MRKTGWYPGNIYPVRVGLYECVYVNEGSEEPWMCYWDGQDWLLFKDGHKSDFGGEFENDKWRGLTKPYKKS
jgi:hypothetical protein